MKNKGFKSIIVALLLLLLCMGQLFTAQAAPSAWAIDILMQAERDNLTLPFSDHQAEITRHNFCQLIRLLVNREMENDFIAEIITKAGQPFSDTNNNNVLFCYGAGIVSGKGEGKFFPDDTLTREQAAVIVVNTLNFIEKHQNSNMIGQTVVAPLDFQDAAQVSPWAANAVSIAHQQGILKGDGVNFNPKESVTCEQANILIYQSFKKLEQQGMAGSYTQAELNSMRYIIQEFEKLSQTEDSDFYVNRPISKAPHYEGEVKRSVIQSGIDALNLARYIAGLPNDVVYDSRYTAFAQAGAVLLESIGHLDHTPGKPADMSEEFYTLAYEGTSQSNLAQGYDEISPVYSVWAYMHDTDESNIAVVGHRRWILNHAMSKASLGMSGNFSVFYVFDKSRAESQKSDFVPWPANVFPLSQMDKDIAWSVSLDESTYLKNIKNEDVKVTLTRQRDNKSWVINRSTGMANGGFFNVNRDGYGSMAAIIFRLPYMQEEALYMKNDVFTVEVEGLAKPLTYTVKFFSLKDKGKLAYTQAR